MKITPISVSYVDRMGSDLSVVNAARVSFDKESDWEVIKEGDENTYAEFGLSDRDRSLIGYLAKHGHWSPFAHTSVQLRIKAPIFVARQLVKHQVGLVWNEVSRRYVASEPEFYFPAVWRGKPVNAKQGSSDTAVDMPPGYVESRIDLLLSAYTEMIEEGVAPELARMILPQNTMTEWWWTGSLMAFARVCHQRLCAHAQKETQEVAVQINKICQEHFPVSWDALMQNKCDC